jgi:hypothetical protein
MRPLRDDTLVHVLKEYEVMGNDALCGVNQHTFSPHALSKHAIYHWYVGVRRRHRND